MTDSTSLLQNVSGTSIAKKISYPLINMQIYLNSLNTTIENEGMACSQMAASMPHLQTLTSK